ncbi:MAG: EamA family transporter [Pseudomonadota bacterium]
MTQIPDTTSPSKGYRFVIAAALLWGVSGSAAKFLFNSGVTPFQLVQARLTITAAGLFIWLGLRHRGLLRIDKKDIGYFAVFGVVGMAAVQFTYLFAISKINVAAAILLQYMAPIFIVLHAAVFSREKLSRINLVALAGATVGCYLVVGAYNLNLLSMNLAGIASGLLSAVCFAWYSIHGEYGMRRYHPWTVLFYAMVFAALTWNICHPPLEVFRHDWRWSQWLWMFYIGILGTLVPFGLYLEGINLIRSTRASITATLEPITAGLIAYLFLGEEMAALQLLGAALVIAAIILLQLTKAHDDNAPDRIRARRQAAGDNAKS